MVISSTKRSLIARVVVAAVLLIAAVLKSQAALTGQTPVTLWVIAQIQGEFLLAYWLLIGLLPRAAWAITFCCFAGFALVNLSKVMEGEAVCGCFGSVRVSPTFSLALDVAVLLLLLWGWPPTHAKSLSRLKVAVLAVVPLLAVVPSTAWLYAQRPSDPIAALVQPKVQTAILVDPQGWEGKRLPLLEWIDIGEDLSDGRWQILFYHHDCPDCQKALLDWISDSGGATSEERFAVIEVPPYGELAEVEAAISLGWAYGRLTDERPWFLRTPLRIQVQDGIVKELTSNISSSPAVARH